MLVRDNAAKRAEIARKQAKLERLQGDPSSLVSRAVLALPDEKCSPENAK